MQCTCVHSTTNRWSKQAAVWRREIKRDRTFTHNSKQVSISIWLNAKWSSIHTSLMPELSSISILATMESTTWGTLLEIFLQAMSSDSHLRQFPIIFKRCTKKRIGTVMELKDKNLSDFATIRYTDVRCSPGCNRYHNELNYNLLVADFQRVG